MKQPPRIIGQTKGSKRGGEGGDKTLQSGSPYTYKLTKTQARSERGGGRDTQSTFHLKTARDRKAQVKLAISQKRSRKRFVGSNGKTATGERIGRVRFSWQVKSHRKRKQGNEHLQKRKNARTTKKRKGGGGGRHLAQLKEKIQGMGGRAVSVREGAGREKPSPYSYAPPWTRARGRNLTERFSGLQKHWK